MFESLTLSDLPAEDEQLRQPVRSIIKESLTSLSTDIRARSWQGFDAEFSRALGKAGLLGLTLPRAYGGAERGPFARFVVVEELLAAGAPVAAHWIADRQSAPLILNFGTEEQRQFYLPRISKGEAFFCIGMSEPGSGSDLASVRTRAEPTDEGWLLNGQKIWTTNAPQSDYMIALVRTSGSPADRQNGLSQLIVDLKAPGVSVKPIVDLTGDAHFAEVFFDNVALSHDALVGEEGHGWRQVTAELAFERSGPERIYSSVVLLDAWVRHITKAGRLESAAALAGRLTAELATSSNVPAHVCRPSKIEVDDGRTPRRIALEHTGDGRRLHRVAAKRHPDALRAGRSARGAIRARPRHRLWRGSKRLAARRAGLERVRRRFVTSNARRR